MASAWISGTQPYSAMVSKKPATTQIDYGPGTFSQGNLSYIPASFTSAPTSVLQRSTAVPQITPQTSGQAPAGGGGAQTLIGPSASTGTNDSAYLDLLRQQYATARSGIEAQSPLLDQSYNQARSDIQTGIDATTAAGQQQKASQEQLFGDLLKNQLQTYQDLNRQRQGTFSALGTLDSSAFGEQQFRADQSFGDQRSRTETEKVKTLNDIDTQINTYTKQAQGQLAQLGIQYQQGKNALAQALAQSNLDEAGAIQSALDQIGQRARQVQDSIANFVNQASLLKAQGVNVQTVIPGINGNDYANQVNNQIAQSLSAGRSLYQTPVNNLQGQGYISPSGKRYNSYAEYLQALAQGQN